jgi:predicted PurR-regulated permease PerM
VKLARIILYLITLAVLVFGVMFYRLIGTYLILAIIFAYILNPWVSWLERRRIPRIAGILIVYLINAAFIAWALYRVLPLIVGQAQNLLAFVTAASSGGEISLTKIPIVQTIQARLTVIDAQVPILKLSENFVMVLGEINKGLINIPNLLVNNYQKILEAVSVIATVPLIGFFLLKDTAQFRKDFLSLIPNRYFEIALILLHKVDEIVGKYLRALFYEVLIVGTLSSVVLTALGVKYGILIGFLAGLANVVPYFGPIMGVLFAVLSILLTGNPLILILYVIIGMYLVQVIDNNLVYPLVIGTTINMHPLFILLTVLAGGWAGGLIGMLVSVPVVYLIYGLLKVLYINLRDFKML